MMKIHGNATIAICDGKSDNDVDRPFTLAQRHEMISAALLSADILDATIVDVADKVSHEEWADAVLDAAGNPSEPLIWSGREDVRLLFEEKNIPTKKIVHVPNIDGAAIRQALASGNIDAWRKKIPAGAIDVVMAVVEKR